MHAVHVARSSDADLQRSIGSCRIVLKGLEQRNQIVDVFQRAPVRVMFPQLGDGRFGEAVLINTAGGVAGGDRLDTDVTALAGATIIFFLMIPRRPKSTLFPYTTLLLAWL